MAHPDTDDGWFKIAIELEAAIAYASFAKAARLIVSYVFFQTFGRGHRPTEAYLPRKELAMRTGQHKQAIDRGFRELIESNVLVDLGSDLYRFVKDYETWMTWSRPLEGKEKGKPVKPSVLRLTPTEVADCKAAPSYANRFQLRGHTNANGVTRNQLVSAKKPVGLEMNPTGFSKETSWVGNETNWFQPPIGTGARPENLRLKREREKYPPPNGGVPGGVGVTSLGSKKKTRREEQAEQLAASAEVLWPTKDDGHE